MYKRQILVGVVLAGRVGAAITAEIGTMKVTEQIDALRVMAVDPVGYLVVPRVVACMVMVPPIDSSQFNRFTHSPYSLNLLS